MPIPLEDFGGAHPDTVLWVDGDSGRVLAFDLLAPNAPAKEIAASLERLMAQEKRSTPPKVRAIQQDLADALKSAYGKGLQVDVGPSLKLENAKRLLLEKAQEEYEEAQEDEEEMVPSYLGEGVTPEMVARLFRVTAKLFQVAPWKYMSDDETPSLSAPTLGLQNAACCVLGEANQSFGLLLFSSADDISLFREYAEQQGGASGSPGVSFLSLELVKGAEIPAEMRKEITKHRWEVANPKAYPALRWVSPDMGLRPYTDRELAQVIAACEALLALVSKHKKELKDGERFRFQETFSSHELPQKPALQVEWPHPQLSPPEMGGGELPEEATALIKSFVATQPAKKAGFAEEVLTDLYHFSLEYVGVAVNRFRSAIVEDFLHSYLPQETSLSEEELQDASALLLSFFAWLEAQGKLHPALVQSIKESLTGAKRGEDHEDGALDIAEEFASMLKGSGFDFSDPDAIAQFTSKMKDGGLDALFSSLLEDSAPVAPAKKQASPKKPSPKKSPKKKPTAKKATPKKKK